MIEGMRDEGGSMKYAAKDAGVVGSVILNPTVEPAKSRPAVRVLKIAAAIFAVVLIAGAIGGYFYWKSLVGTPQYSLALLVDAARRDDQTALNQLVDSDAAVDDFVPQVIAKAIELYGRGVPPQLLARIERMAAPLMPAVKDRAREELPRLIREKTAKFENVPFAAMVLGADRYLEIETNGNAATVKSKLPEHSFEMRMTKNGDKWKVVGVSDERLATTIAQKIGQDVIAIATNGNGTGRPATFKDFQDIMKQAQDIFR